MALKEPVRQRWLVIASYLCTTLLLKLLVWLPLQQAQVVSGKRG